MVARKLSIDQRLAIVDKWQQGTPLTTLAVEYGVTVTTITKHVKLSGLRRLKNNDVSIGPDQIEEKKELTQYAKFAAEAKDVLRAQEFDGKGVDAHTTWTNWVEILQHEGFTRQQAVVTGSKGFACLRRLYMKYDVYEHDTKPDSHPDVKHKRDLRESKAKKTIPCEDRELSYRDNIRWAVEAAGHWLRTGKDPEITPNDTAWFLFCMAREEPKDVMSKINQVEARDPGDDEDDRQTRREGKRMIAQLDEMIGEMSTIIEEEKNDENS